MHRTILSTGIMAIVAALLAGCGSGGPELYRVGGKVTMDGKPLAHAEVRFLPIPKGTEAVRPSSAITDENGNYTLEYSSRKSGARPGEYQVFISTKRKAMPEIPAVPESVPDVYNTKTRLQADIDKQSRTFNFDLVSSEGKVPAQPANAE